MPLVGQSLKTKFQATLLNALKREFASELAKGGSYESEAIAHHTKLANAISDVAMDIVNAITTEAQVLPGQSIVGVGGGIPGPVSGTTVSPGKIA